MESNKNGYVDAKVEFLRLGGTPTLDFCNTVIGDPVEEDILANRELVDRFSVEFFKVPSKVSRDEYLRLITFRSLLREFFASMLGVRSKAGFGRARTELNSFLSQCGGYPTVLEARTVSGVRWGFEAKRSTDPFGAFLTEFFHFLDSIEEGRLKKCGNPACTHFFYDTSKSRTRNWCSMESCGNVMKARAFQERQRLRKVK